MSHRPWTAKQFRRDFPEMSQRERKAYLAVCNTAIANGLSRQEVAKTIAEVANQPDFSPTKVVAALAQKVHPISDEERAEHGISSAEEEARAVIKEVREGGSASA